MAGTGRGRTGWRWGRWVQEIEVEKDGRRRPQLDLSALEELEGGSTGRRAQEREKAPSSPAGRLYTATASAPQRVGEGITKMVEEDGEKRESEIAACSPNTV
jgi:hypothetical protein